MDSVLDPSFFYAATAVAARALSINHAADCVDMACVNMRMAGSAGEVRWMSASTPDWFEASNNCASTTSYCVSTTSYLVCCCTAHWDASPFINTLVGLQAKTQLERESANVVAARAAASAAIAADATNGGESDAGKNDAKDAAAKSSSTNIAVVVPVAVVSLLVVLAVGFALQRKSNGNSNALGGTEQEHADGFGFSPSTIAVTDM
jgi:hypothetical protein